MSVSETSLRGFRVVWEEELDAFPAVAHPEWAESFSWLVQGTTTREARGRSFDLGLFTGASPKDEVLAHWEELRSHAGLPSVLNARQVHGPEVWRHETAPPGLTTMPEPCDGHATLSADILLTVTTADCVPVFLVDPARRAISMLHAGWRGAAAGVLERGIEALCDRGGSATETLLVHFGPAICGRCYEVGIEVFDALNQPVPRGPVPIDLRMILAERAVAKGVAADAISISGHCTRCTAVDFFSHRGGDRGRQVGFLGVRG